ncbi:A-kinase anchor protein 14 [Fasciolopsis buskii]|uniref:A-kinase anchor protein 14 n=1 Tax=Fasciolopsis buskii TaxID=27845 RepID=A0A8E0RLK9_9TREM|nr:A-kinase anchor protein 14 [Fasciolopsis buski]
MHNSYYSVKPCQNKYLQMRFDYKVEEKHKKTLANMKPTVDTTPPRTFYLVHNRPKRNFFMKETSERIERENLRLIKRMEEIMHLKGFVDNQNRYKPKSLNEDFRRREIQRIMRDNEDLVRRMNQRLMTYRGPRWEESWAHTLTYLDNISKYPSFLKKDEKRPTSQLSQCGRNENKTIPPFVETVENIALDKLDDINPDQMLIDFDSPVVKKLPNYCQLVQQESTNQLPEEVRGFVASVIQTSLQQVYQQGLLSDKPHFDEGTLEAAISMVEDQQREERSGQPNLMNMNVYEPCDDEINETGKQSIRLSDEVHPTPNIQWPTIGEFTPEQGLKKIEEYIKGWNVDESWLHCTDILPVEELPYDVNHRYRVRWSMPTRRSPIPAATVSIYFTIQVSKIKPKHSEVGVYYQVETFRTKHRPGATRFCKRWLRDVIDNKMRLMSYVKF